MSKEFDPRWESRMTLSESRWCWGRLYAEAQEHACVDGYRAAQAWKSTQVRRFKKLRTCCGSKEWVEYRWNWRKLRFDKYLLGFNYGH
jgi:hypothetical protein